MYNLQQYLTNEFEHWKPPAPEVLARSKGDITLSWSNLEPFGFLVKEFLYRVEKKKKIPPWVVVYSGGKTTKIIDNLEPSHPHKFRLKIIIRAEAVPFIADKALQHYGDENAVYSNFNKCQNVDGIYLQQGNNNGSISLEENKTNDNIDEHRDGVDTRQTDKICKKNEKKWLESNWSEETWTSTDTDGTSAVCFCMAVRCAYLKQVQVMLEEKPGLINTINPNSGFTPLATAVRKGDINTIRFLLNMGADVDQPSLCGKTALHLAVLTARKAVADLLLERGANLQARDVNGLRVEHFAVDSGSVEMLKFALDKGGDVHTRDNNAWTPLFRAVVQGSPTEIIEELLRRGGDIRTTDRAGLTVASVGRLLKNRHGRARDSVLRLVDAQYPHDKAVANFTRLTKKISSVHSLLK